MKRTELNRRDFNKLTMAALGGVVAGTAIGCGSGDEDEKKTGGTTPETPGPPGGDPDGDGDPKVALNACRGLNTCSEAGQGEHDCAGKGSCYTVEKHDCATLNTCQYLGGCHGKAGINECKEMGGCGVPMDADSDAWKQAHDAFVERMKKDGKEVGPAPEPAAS